MEVVVNGIPVFDLIASLDISELLSKPFSPHDAPILDLLFSISTATEQSTATRFLAAHLYNRVSALLPASEGLTALACILISSKFVETSHVSIEDLARFADGQVTKSEIVQAESAVMSALDYTVRTPTLFDWVSLFTLWISPYLHESVWQRLRTTAILITELMYETGNLLVGYSPALLTVGVIQTAVYVLTKSVGVCGLTSALARIIKTDEEEVTALAELILCEALGSDFLHQFTLQ